MPATLDGCWAKQRHAQQHFECLRGDVRAFIDREPHRVVGNLDPESGDYIARIEVSEEPEEFTWGLLVGDIIHNLRCVLDHLVWQLVILNGRRPGTQNQFPIADRCRQYWAVGKKGEPSLRDRRLAGVAEEHRAVVDSLQPYHRGDAFPADPLYTIRELSNIDKHRLVHVTRFVVDGPGEDALDLQAVGDAEGIAEVTVKVRQLLEHNAEVFRISSRTTRPNAKVKVKAQVPIYIGFGEAGFRLEAVFDALVHTGSILKTFEPFFGGHAAPPTG